MPTLWHAHRCICRTTSERECRGRVSRAQPHAVREASVVVGRARVVVSALPRPSCSRRSRGFRMSAHASQTTVQVLFCRLTGNVPLNVLILASGHGEQSKTLARSTALRSAPPRPDRS
jgi:hypothetical protein